MGQRVEFSSNAQQCEGYFASPQSGRGPAVVVVQEWWGLVPHITDIVERFAREGFVAIAPDLYHGKMTTSPDEAGKLKMELDADRAAREIAAAGEFLLHRPECTSKTYGVVGFCLGGALAQYVAAKEHNVSAAVSFYGGFRKLQYDWKNLRAPLLLICAEEDPSVTPEKCRDIEKQLKDLGKPVELVIYRGADHAFFNDTRPEVYKSDASADAWKRTVAWFRKHIR